MKNSKPNEPFRAKKFFFLVLRLHQKHPGDNVARPDKDVCYYDFGDEPGKYIDCPSEYVDIDYADPLKVLRELKRDAIVLPLNGDHDTPREEYPARIVRVEIVCDWMMQSMIRAAWDQAVEASPRASLFPFEVLVGQTIDNTEHQPFGRLHDYEDETPGDHGPHFEWFDLQLGPIRSGFKLGN